MTVFVGSEKDVIFFMYIYRCAFMTAMLVKMRTSHIDLAACIVCSPVPSSSALIIPKSALSNKK